MVINKLKDIIKIFINKLIQLIKNYFNRKKDFVVSRVKDYLDKYVFNKFRLLKQNKRLLILLLSCILSLSGGALYLFMPQVKNHYKSDNNSLSFVEYNTNENKEQSTESVSNNNSASETVAPVNYQMDNSYGWPTNGNYYITTYFTWGHDGIDIAGCGYNSNIYAIFRGEVVTASYTSTNGNYIVVKHDDGKYSMYAHLASIYVSPGQRVEKGTVIGGMGATGYATGVHLHFSIWTGYPYYGGQALNPYNFY